MTGDAIGIDLLSDQRFGRAGPVVVPNSRNRIDGDRKGAPLDILFDQPADQYAAEAANPWRQCIGGFLQLGRGLRFRSRLRRIVRHDRRRESEEYCQREKLRLHRLSFHERRWVFVKGKWSCGHRLRYEGGDQERKEGQQGEDRKLGGGGDVGRRRRRGQ